MSRFKQLARAKAMALRMAKQEELKVLQAMHRRAIASGTPVTFQGTVTGVGSTSHYMQIAVDGVPLSVDVPWEVHFHDPTFGNPDAPQTGDTLQFQYFEGKIIGKHKLSTS